MLKSEIRAGLYCSVFISDNILCYTQYIRKVIHPVGIFHLQLYLVIDVELWQSKYIFHCSVFYRFLSTFLYRFFVLLLLFFVFM